MSKCRCCTFKEVLDEELVDEGSNFDPDIADSLSDSSKQVSEIGWQNSVKIAEFSHSLRCFKSTTFDTVVTPQMFLSSSFTDC